MIQGPRACRNVSGHSEPQGAAISRLGLLSPTNQPLECLDLQFLDSWLTESLPGFRHKVKSTFFVFSGPSSNRGREMMSGFAAGQRERQGALKETTFPYLCFKGSLPLVLPATCSPLPLLLPGPSLSLPSSPCPSSLGVPGRGSARTGN